MTSPITRMLIISRVVELIAKKYKIKINEARDLFYSSETCEKLYDEETGLYGESPLSTFELFNEEYKKLIVK